MSEIMGILKGHRRLHPVEDDEQGNILVTLPEGTLTASRLILTRFRVAEWYQHQWDHDGDEGGIEAAYARMIHSSRLSGATAN